MKSRLRIPVVLMFVFLSGCADDPAEPRPYCETSGDCGIEGLDLAIVDAALEFDRDQVFRAAVDAHVVESGDEVTLGVLIVNRGSEPTEPARIRVSEGWRFGTLASAPVPALEPGAERRIEIDFETPSPAVWHDTLIAVDVFLATDTTDWYDDADFENNARFSREELAYHPLVPIISVAWTSPDTVRALEQATGSVAFTNHSPFVAAPPLTWRICFADDGVSCDDGPDGPPVTTGAITAGATSIAAVGYLVPSVEIGIHEPADEVGAAICAYTEGDWVSERACVLPYQLLWVRPNLQATCEPEVIAPPDTVLIGSANVCYIDNDFERWHVAAFDGVAGTDYRIATVSGDDLRIRVRDENTIQIADVPPGAEPTVFTAPETRRYFLLTYLGIQGPVPETTIALEIVD